MLRLPNILAYFIKSVPIIDKKNISTSCGSELKVLSVEVQRGHNDGLAHKNYVSARNVPRTSNKEPSQFKPSVRRRVEVREGRRLTAGIIRPIGHSCHGCSSWMPYRPAGSLPHPHPAVSGDSPKKWRYSRTVPHQAGALATGALLAHNLSSHEQSDIT